MKIKPADGKDGILTCHCPCTGRIGSIRLGGIPCLFSRSGKKGRKTPCTVEAISLDTPGKRAKRWVGINQVEANRYVEFFLKNGMLGRMVKGGERAERERKLGKSRIDFEAGNAFIEVKTLLMDLPCGGHPNFVPKMPPFVHFERMVKHFGDLGKAVGRGSRAIMLLCYLYDAEPFRVPKPDRKTIRIQRAAMAAQSGGLETWQINLILDREGVRLAKYFPLRLFR
jgi:sugar fermentation stimulation protein A